MYLPRNGSCSISPTENEARARLPPRLRSSLSDITVQRILEASLSLDGAAKAALRPCALSHPGEAC